MRLCITTIQTSFQWMEQDVKGITSPAEASVSVRVFCQNSLVQTQEKLALKWPFLAVSSIFLFFKVLVWLFHFVNGSFQAVYSKRMYSSPKISSFFSANCFCLHETSAVCTKYTCSGAHIAVQACSEGCVLRERDCED